MEDWDEVEDVKDWNDEDGELLLELEIRDTLAVAGSQMEWLSRAGAGGGGKHLSLNLPDIGNDTKFCVQH